MLKGLRRTWTVWMLVGTAPALVAELSPALARESCAGLFDEGIRLHSPVRRPHILPYKRDHNFRTVDRGRLYRSGWMPPDVLRKSIRYFNIRTVINLVGPDPKLADRERLNRVSEERGLVEGEGARFVHVELEAHRDPSHAQLRLIMEAIQESEGAVLIHCRAGSDRTGLISAFYMIERMGIAPEVAARSALRFFPYGNVWLVHPESRDFIRNYEPGSWSVEAESNAW